MKHFVHHIFIERRRSFVVHLATVAVVVLHSLGARAEVRVGDVAARTINEGTVVEMKIFTTGGFVGFTVGGNWTVLSMNSQLPIASALFQLPNVADEGTPESTNLVLMLYEPNSERGREAFKAPVVQYGEKKPQMESLHEWKIYRQTAKKGSVVYSILDAKREGVADVKVSVRLAWPHLEANSVNYDDEMESTFRSFLSSIYGKIGFYTPVADEVIRRLKK